MSRVPTVLRAYTFPSEAAAIEWSARHRTGAAPVVLARGVLVPCGEPIDLGELEANDASARAMGATMEFLTGGPTLEETGESREEFELRMGLGAYLSVGAVPDAVH